MVVETDAAHLLVRRRGDFHVAADAEAAQFAFSLRFLSAPGKARHLARRERLLEDRAEVAAIHRHRGSVLVRDLGGLEMVAPADLEAVDAELARRLVAQA